MKIAIIGAGNMGGALARGLASSGKFPEEDILVSNRSEGKLAALKAQYPGIFTTTVNQEAVQNADVIVLAVEPPQVPQVMEGIVVCEGQIFVSIVAGLSFSSIHKMLGNDSVRVFKVIPNTAMTVYESMTLICGQNASPEETATVESIFSPLGKTMEISEEKMAAATALSSCGIAYALKFIDAGITAGVHMGIGPKDSAKLVAQAMAGAAKIILEGDTPPAEEVLKVCTPGGLTIKGVKALEDGGFPAAIINAMIAASGKQYNYLLDI